MSSSSAEEVLSPSALLKRIHAVEREAAERERRDAAVVAGLRREVADLEARLLEAMAVAYHHHDNAGNRSRPSSREPSPTPTTAELAPHRSSSRLRLAQREEKLVLDRTAFETKVRELEATLGAWEQRLRAQEEELSLARIKMETSHREASEKLAKERLELQQRSDKLRRQELECKAILDSIVVSKGKPSTQLNVAKATAMSSSSGAPPPPSFRSAKPSAKAASRPVDPVPSPAVATTATSVTHYGDQLAAIDAEIETYDRALKAAHHAKLGAQAKRSFLVRAQTTLSHRNGASSGGGGNGNAQSSAAA